MLHQEADATVQFSGEPELGVIYDSSSHSASNVFGRFDEVARLKSLPSEVSLERGPARYSIGTAELRLTPSPLSAILKYRCCWQALHWPRASLTAQQAN